jgi:hypothetical protein
MSDGNKRNKITFMLYLVRFVLIHVQQSHDIEPEKKQVRVLLRGYVTASGVQTDTKWDSSDEKQTVELSKV